MMWLRCVANRAGRGYWLNSSQIIKLERRDGWWRAVDVRNIEHQVCVEEEPKVAGLLDGGREIPGCFARELRASAV